MEQRSNSWTVPVCSSSPTLRTNEVSNITDTSVTFSGTIEAPTCDPSVTSQGFVYGLNTLPKTTDEVIEVNGKVHFKRNNRTATKSDLLLPYLFHQPNGNLLWQ